MTIELRPGLKRARLMFSIGAAALLVSAFVVSRTSGRIEYGVCCHQVDCPAQTISGVPCTYVSGQGSVPDPNGVSQNATTNCSTCTVGVNANLPCGDEAARFLGINNNCNAQ